MPHKFKEIELHYLGEKGSGYATRGGVQDYTQLLEQYTKSGKQFEDPEFPANDSSIFLDERHHTPVVWKRPLEIREGAKFVIKGKNYEGFVERFDVVEGEDSGNSWLMAPMSLLPLYEPLFDFIVPQDQVLGVTGIIHFRIWQYGHWVDVVIDDRLPTHKDELIFARLPIRNSLWAILLEKAFAKLEGTYDALFQGPLPDPLENFTGGVAEFFDDSEDEFNNFETILRACEMKSLMSCTTSPDERRLQKNGGIVAYHTYCISKVINVDIRNEGNVKLLKLREPGGKEWRGAWSDYWKNWRNIPETDKLKLPYEMFLDDGEFWISFEDYKKNFSGVSICHINPFLLQEELFQDVTKKTWKLTMVEGEWVRGVNAGGQPYYGTFWLNPQYKFEVPNIDQSKKKYSLIIALMEKFIGKRRKTRRKYPEGHTIGFRVYKLDGPYINQTRPITAEFLAVSREKQVSQAYTTNQRQKVKRVELYPGTYCIVPALGRENEEGKFLLRFFSEINVPLKVLDQEIKARTIREVIEATTNGTVNLDDEKVNEENLRKLFKEYAGADEKMYCFELKEVLDFIMRNDTTEVENTSWNTFYIWNLFRGKTAFETNGGFSKDACRSMIALVDADRSGKLGFEEFKYLYNIIKAWKTVFESYDSSDTGYLNPFDLRPALNSAGYELSNRVINALCHRYAGRDGSIAIDDFLLCAVRLESMMEIFKDKDPNNTKVATFTVEEWMENAIYS